MICAGDPTCTPSHAHVRRGDRKGFKAGNLAYGLSHSDAPFVAVLDADFVPPADFLRRTVPALLADSGLAFVQSRWGHANRAANWLTGTSQGTPSNGLSNVTTAAVRLRRVSSASLAAQALATTPPSECPTTISRARGYWLERSWSCLFRRSALAWIDC